MTRKPTEDGHVVEIDAMDESEWEKDRHTPVASDEELRVLVRQSSDKSAPVAAPVAVKQQTTAATVKRTPTPVPTKTPTPVPVTRSPTPAPKPPPTPAAAKPPAPVAAATPAPIKRPIRPAAAPPSAVIPPKKDASAPIKRTDSVVTAVGDASGAIKPGTTVKAPVVAGSDPLAGIRAISQGPRLASGASATRDALATVRAISEDQQSAAGANATDGGLADGSGSLPPAAARPRTPTDAARRLPLPAPRMPRPSASPVAATPPVAQPAIGEDAATILSPPLAVDDFIGGASDPALLAIPIEPTNEVPPQRDPSRAKVPHAEPSYPKASRDDLRSARGDASEAKVVVGAADSGPNRRLDTAGLGRGRDPSDADIELAGAHPVVGASPVREAVAGFAKNKRNLAIAAGAVVVLIVLVVVMMDGGSKKSSSKGKQVAKTTHAAKTTPSTPSESETPTEVAGAATPSGSAAAGETETPTEAPTQAAAESPSEHKSEHHRKKPTLAGKQVVLEYDNQARDAKPVAGAPKDDQAAIGKARNAYATGNTRLFAGDADGAITNYKQALAYYPAYVAGYRGLGLAYAQKGDKAAATKALRTYLNAVPSAKDAGLIRKRIQTLK